MADHGHSRPRRPVESLPGSTIRGGSRRRREAGDRRASGRFAWYRYGVVEADVLDRVVAAAKTGAEWAWERLYGELSGPLLGYAGARGAADPSDIVGEVFLDLARGIGSFEGGWAAFKGWAFLIASHRVVDDHRRRSRRHEDAHSEVPDVATGDLTGDAVDEVLGIDRARVLLTCLSPEQREVLLLRIFGDLPIDEVAWITGRSVTGVKALQRRGLGALRRILSSEAVSR